MSAEAPLRIAELISARGFNGAARVCGQMCDGLAERGHDVTLFHRASLDVGGLVGPAVHRVETPLSISIAELRRVARLMSERRIDVVHSHTTDAQKYAALLRLFWGFPSVVTAHNAHRFDVHWWVHDEVIALSQASSDYHRRVNRVGAARLTVVPNFIEQPAPAETGPAARATWREKLGLPDNAFVVGAIGDIDKRKNQSVLGQAIADLVGQGLDIRLVLIGTLKDQAEVARCQAAAQSCPGRIHLTGFMADAARALPAFDVYALPSRFETLPLSILEAMSHGLPVVSTPVGGIPDLVRDGTTGFLVPAADRVGLAEHLSRLARDPALTSRLGEAGRQASTRFSRAATLDGVEAVLRRAAEAGCLRRAGRTTNPGTISPA